MSDGSKDEQTAKLLKRPNEENEDSAEKLQTTKRIKVDGELTEDEKKYPKKKVVLLMAYCGKGYYGMQVCTLADLSVLSCFLFCLTKFKRVLYFREILETLSLGPLKMIWSLHCSNLVAFLKTTVMT